MGKNVKRGFRSRQAKLDKTGKRSMGKNPAHGQLVIAERIMHQGGLVETTIKEYRQNGKSVELWPKSSNPKHSQPIRLLPVRGAEDVEVRIVGVVVAKYVPM